MHEKMTAKLISTISSLVSKTVLNNGKVSFGDNLVYLGTLTTELNKRKDSIQLELLESIWIYMDAMNYVIHDVLNWETGNIISFENQSAVALSNISHHVLDFFCNVCL